MFYLYYTFYKFRAKLKELKLELETIQPTINKRYTFMKENNNSIKKGAREVRKNNEG